MRKLVFDLDDLLIEKRRNQDDLLAHIMEQVDLYRGMGFEITLMISAKHPSSELSSGSATLDINHEMVQQIEYLGFSRDGISFGVPSTDSCGLLVDDKAITPEEFIQNSFAEITELISGSKTPGKRQ